MEDDVDTHAKEPWRSATAPHRGSVHGAIVADSGPAVGGSGKGSGPDEARARDYYGGVLIAESIHPDNQRRILACVNACAGIATAQLEAMGADETLTIRRP